MSLADSVHTYLIPQLADVLTGFGLSALLEFSHVSPDMQFFTAICLGVVLALGVLILIYPCKLHSHRGPAWLRLCNTTYSLVITLALSLNLLSQLCPPSGRDLCLIPVYVLLCVPKTPPSNRALLMQAGVGVLLLGVFLSQSTSRIVRPVNNSNNNNNNNTEGALDSLALAVSVLGGTCLNTFGFRSEALELLLVQPDRRWQAFSVVCKGLLLVLLGSAVDTSLYHFMYDRPSAVSMELFAGYGVLLLFACMQTASVWFMQLKEILGRQAQWRLVVRIQHVIYAMMVAAAWVYPLQLHALRVLILSVLLGLNALSKLEFW